MLNEGECGSTGEKHGEKTWWEVELLTRANAVENVLDKYDE